MVIKMLSAFTAVLVLVTCQCSARTPPQAAAGPGGAPPVNAPQEYVEAHNAARSEVGVGPLRWSDALAKSASLTVRLQRDKKNCSFADLSNSKYGGNQLWAGGFTVTARVAVETWVAEKKFYNYGNNTCAAGNRCGVYTQVVWRNSAEVGCGQAVCGGKDPSSLTICLYNPPGNIVGEKPY